MNIRKGNATAAITPLKELVKRQPQIPQAHLLLADAYSAQKNLDEATAVLRAMMPLFPKSPQVPFALGTALLEQKKYAEARQSFEKSRELSPQYIPALERLVDLDLLDKQFANATGRIKQQMEISTNSADPWLLLAKVHMTQTNWNDAETDLLKAVEVNPSLRNPYLLLAQVYVASGKHQQALDRLNGLVAKNTNDIGALMQIGMIYDAVTNYPAARDAYEKALIVNPNFGYALNNLAYLYSEHLNQLDKAYVMAEKAGKLDPNNPSLADTLGWILYKRGDYNRALGLIQQAADKLPANAEIQFHLGSAHYMLGEEEPARVALQRSVQATREFAGKDQVARRLAVLAINAKTADPSAAADLEKKLAEEPNDPVALSRLAAIQERDGAFEKAVRTYERALKQNPQNAQIMGKVALLYFTRLHDSKKALELAKEAHNLAPDDAGISYTLGRLAFGEHDYKWSLSLLEDAARKLPDDPELTYDLAMANYNMGRLDQAEAGIKSFIQSAAGSARLEDAKRFLAMLDAARSPAQAQAAKVQIQQALTADPAYLPALMASACLQEQQEKYAEAKGLYEKILAANPLFIPATRQLTILCSQHFADEPKAYDLAVKAREAFPDDPEIAKALGIQVYRRGKDYPRSVQLLRESAQKRTDDADLQYYLGMSLYKLKQPKEAVSVALNRALELNVQPGFRDEVKRVLSELK